MLPKYITVVILKVCFPNKVTLKKSQHYVFQFINCYTPVESNPVRAIPVRLSEFKYFIRPYEVMYFTKVNYCCMSVSVILLATYVV